MTDPINWPNCLQVQNVQADLHDFLSASFALRQHNVAVQSVQDCFHLLSWLYNMQICDISVNAIRCALTESQPEVLLQYLINMLYARYLKRSFNGLQKENYATLHLEAPFVKGTRNGEFDNFSFLDSVTQDQVTRGVFDCFKNVFRGI